LQTAGHQSRPHEFDFCVGVLQRPNIRRRRRTKDSTAAVLAFETTNDPMSSKMSRASPSHGKLPDHLKDWDGRTSQFSNGKLAYFAPAPRPPPHGAAGAPESPAETQQRADMALATEVHRHDKLATLLEPVGDGFRLSAADVTDILNEPATAADGALQDEINAMLRGAVAVQARHNDAADGMEEKRADVVAARERREEEQREADKAKEASPSMAKARRRKEEAHPPPLAKAAPLAPSTDDGKFLFKAGIETNMRFAMGAPTLHPYKVMSLPWNQALLSEEDQEMHRDKDRRRRAKKDRDATLRDEEAARADHERQWRAGGKQLQQQMADELNDRVVEHRRKVATEEAAPAQQETAADDAAETPADAEEEEPADE
jgi:hypothetical protein